MKNTKKKVIGILSGLCACAVCVAIPNVVTADAELANVSMVKGASVRLDNPSGLKFTAEIAGEYSVGETTSYGMMIVPYDYLVTAGVEIAEDTDYITELMTAYEEGVISVAPIVAENLPAKADEDGGYYIEHSIVQLDEKNFDRRFFGVAFEEVDGEYTYATNVENSRSIMEVASGALNDLYYNADNLPEDVKNLLADNETLLSDFVTVGLSYSADWSYAVAGESTVGMDGSIALSVDSDTNVHLLPTWTSSDETIATVDKNGVVTGLKVGTVTITATNKVGDTVYTDTHEVQVIPTTPDQIVDALYELSSGASLPGTYTLTGAVQKINSSSVNVVLITPTRTDKPVSCYKLTGEGLDSLQVGDTVTVTGALKNYSGTYEFDNPTLDSVDSTVALNDKQKVAIDKANLSFGSYTVAYENADTAEVQLPAAVVGSSISWDKENAEELNVTIADGKAVFTFTEEEQTIKLVATITSNDEAVTRVFTLTVEAKPAALPEGQVRDEISFAEVGGEAEELSYNGEFIAVTFKKGTSSNKPYNPSGHIRSYANNEIVFTPNGGYKFKSAVIHCTTTSYMGYDTAGSNSITVPEGVTAVGDTTAKTVTLTAAEPVSEFTIIPSKQIRITSIEFVLVEVSVSNEEKVAAVKAELEGLTISEDMTSLPVKSENNYPEDVSIAWTSDNSAFTVAADGTVTLNRALATETTAIVTATISHKDDDTVTTTHTFEVTVDSVANVVGAELDAAMAETLPANIKVGDSLELPATIVCTNTTVTMSWSCSAIAVAGVEGSTVTFLAAADSVTLTADMLVDGESIGTKEFAVAVLAEDVKEIKYTFSDYTAGTQYAENEKHVLDDIVTVTTTQAHFTTQLRIYSSSSHDGFAIIESQRSIEKIVLNAGNKADTLNVYGSTDGTTWTLIEGVATTSSYADYTVTMDSAYKWIKLDVAGTQQVRIAYMTLTFAD